ncbi:TetR/AcrR family transcriptional regulator [Rhodococcus spongiicola]|uniref:TetR family transcriptional regulator n=1 Tax=Rhodococcus spongiicola TaxID=2487352 RepID=A0A438B6G0_9NOCA|nr:TetR family transcriptional regulator [Rhodococcus spongiicola]RVW06502.1 TetR family transcriptional regulator [Rhodococcus spongiicola]
MTSAPTPKGERRRQALVTAAADLLLEGGFDAVRHRAVASRADLPLASTTYYFGSLDELVALAVEHNGNRELDTMRERVDGLPQRRRGGEATVDLIVELLVGPDEVDDSGRERLIARYERFLASARHPELRDVQLRLRAQLDDLLAEVLRRSGRIVWDTRLRRLVAVVDGVVVGALSEVDPDPRAMVRAMLLDLIDDLAPSRMH